MHTRPLTGASLDGLAAQMESSGAATSTVLPASYRVFASGSCCHSYVIVRSGCVRVHQLDSDGREIVLYRIGPGQTCILNACALLSSQPYAAYAITETEVLATLVPTQNFDRLIATSAEFRASVFHSYAERIFSLIALVNDLAFERIDVRLARRLLELAGAEVELHSTHAALAVELGTAREVVSRQLKLFEEQRLLDLSRGVIYIRNRVKLRQLASPAPSG